MEMGIYKRSVRERTAGRAISRRWGERNVRKHKIHHNCYSYSFLLKQYQRSCYKAGITPKYFTRSDWNNRLEDNKDTKSSEEPQQNEMDVAEDYENLQSEHNFNKVLCTLRDCLVSETEVDIERLRVAVNLVQAWKGTMLQEISCMESED